MSERSAIDDLRDLCNPMAECLGDKDRIDRFVAAGLAVVEEYGRAVADKRRLDFLDGLNASLNARYGTTYRWEMVTTHNVNRLMFNQMMVDLNDAAALGLPSCRDAIDAKMRAFGAKGPPRPSAPPTHTMIG